MGFLSGLLGGKAKKQKAGPDEKAQALSAARDMRRLQTKFYPLQEQVAAEADKDFSDHFAGVANADAALAEKDAIASATRNIGAGGRTALVSRLARVGDDVASLRGEGQTDALEAATSLKDGRKLGVSGLAYGLAAEAGRGLSSLASNEVSRNMSKLHMRTNINNARAQAIGQLVGATGAKAYSSSTPSFDQNNYDVALRQGKAGAGSYATYHA